MEMLHGYTVVGEWKNGQRGKTARAERGGKTYFIKMYTSYVLPTKDGMFDKKTIQKKEKEFNAFVGVRRRVIKALTPYSGDGGNIVIPCDNFVEDNHYFEVTEYIPGAIPDSELESFLRTLSYDSKRQMMQTAAGALASVHAAGVIHSDVKLKNILVVKNPTSGRFVTKLIDFDSSYFADDISFVGGDDVYCSPELSDYISAEEDDEIEEAAKKLTCATDIFSLGVVFHYYLSGGFPQPKEMSVEMRTFKERRERAGKPVVFYPSTILDYGCELQLDSHIRSVNVRSVLYDMLAKDYTERPTAMQVLSRLKDPDEPIIEEPWSEHRLMLNKAGMSKAGVVGLRKRLVGTEKLYEVLVGDGKSQLFSRDALIRNGYARQIVEGYPDCWPEHSIVFCEDRLALRGFVSGERDTFNDINGYRLYRADGADTFFRVEMLLGLSYAKEKKPEVVSGFAEPWEEHGIVFDMDMIGKKGYIRADREVLNGVKGYRFYMADGSNRFVRAEMAVVLKLAKNV